MWKAPPATGGWTRDGGAVRIGGSPRARFAACACNVEGVAPKPEACAGFSPEAVAYIGGLAAEAVVHFGCGSGGPSAAPRTRVRSASSTSAGGATRATVVGWTGAGERQTGAP